MIPAKIFFVNHLYWADQPAVPRKGDFLRLRPHVEGEVKCVTWILRDGKTSVEIEVVTHREPRP